MARKTKMRTATARVIGPILHQGYASVLWKVRLKVPYLPFYLDSEMCYHTKDEAEKVAEKWRRKRVVVEVSDAK